MTTPLLHRTATQTVDGTTTTAIFPLPQYFGGTKLHFGNVTSLTGTLSLSFDGGAVYTDWPSHTNLGVLVAAGGTITTADDLDAFFEGTGATHVKFTRTGGSGPVELVCAFAADAGEMAIMRQLLNSASALDTNIVKHNGTEYTILRTVVELTATGNLLAASASAYNHIIDGTIVLAAGEAADSFYLNDGTINLFGGSSQKLPLSPDGSAGPVGYHIQNLKTGAVNRAIVCTLAGGSNVVATFRYIQPTT